ncbi:TPA: hypothetical protein JAN90_01215 [Legionella pneumophila]|nr:hypothetical protein [Legionella pneumophila]HAT8866606.1 hypothetical protein [Legionella pneumophila subsp. pneumophila]HAT7071422.1 hypothetical protein [Legionella pneumophila]HAT8640576.1 hypothetical protein [Legionella pneumophila]HAT8888451.1 hypothetical protein [Legionella pneumophila subsp. pneumophila]HAT8932990.1 hypothetical protein [Legionella pneumophila subsp. pneumophila]
MILNITAAQFPDLTLNAIESCQNIYSKRLIFNALFQIYLMWALDRDYIRSSQYPESVWAEEMRKHRLEALTRNIKFHTRL